MHNAKRKLVILISIILSIDIIICISLFKSRAFPRLAIWSIIESNKQSDFYWQPQYAPEYFYFEPYNQKLEAFKDEMSELIKDKENDLEKSLIIANYVMNLGKNILSIQKRVCWDNPYNMLRQIKEGKFGSCFHYSIIFSTYLASIGMKSRLWALEGDDGLGRFGHTVAEVYIKDLNKWVMIDVTNKIYFKENNLFLSVLELRGKLLDEKMQDLIIEGDLNRDLEQKISFPYYRRLLKMVFLRSANDFLNKYDAKIRYGRLYKLQKFFDKFPSEMRRGLDYLLGRRDYLIHYVDRFDKSLRPKIILAKISFYFLVISSIFIVVLSVFVKISKKLCSR